MTDQKITPDEKSEKVEEKKAPVQEHTDNAKEEKAQAPLNVPEKLQGKSPEEIAEMYVSLEKKFGEHSKEVNEARKYLKERQVINSLLEEDKDLYNTFEEKLKKKYQPNEKKDDGEAKIDPVVSDIRRAEENKIIGSFQQNYGIQEMDKEKRSEVMRKVSSQMADMVDPSGKKSMTEVLSSVSLVKLPKLLEDAYFLAYKDSFLDKGKRDEDVASIGRFATASSGKSDPISELTEREREIAKKLNVDPEKYLKRKQEINN